MGPGTYLAFREQQYAALCYPTSIYCAAAFWTDGTGQHSSPSRRNNLQRFHGLNGLAQHVRDNRRIFLYAHGMCLMFLIGVKSEAYF